MRSTQGNFWWNFTTILLRRALFAYCMLCYVSIKRVKVFFGDSLKAAFIRVSHAICSHHEKILSATRNRLYKPLTRILHIATLSLSAAMWSAVTDLFAVMFGSHLSPRSKAWEKKYQLNEQKYSSWFWEYLPSSAFLTECAMTTKMTTYPSPKPMKKN